MSTEAFRSNLDSAPETAVLIGVQKPGEKDWEVSDALDELAQLADTAGVRVLERFIRRQREPNPAYFIGKGQAAELAGVVAATGAQVAVFDEDLSPAQGRNIEHAIGVRAVDRTQVILDIFAQHAHTREGRVQIELAQLRYILPRLRRMWTHLERQKGGIGLKGPGEQQLELDRRRIEQRITRLRQQLEHVRSRRGELRRGRTRHGWALIGLVGYTNAGKSSLLNALTGSSVTADDKLFATLDPTTRRLDLPNHQAALVTDTVGFIRKLPHRLVESFKATLEEVTEADLLVHVVDASHPHVAAQVRAVEDVLRELGAHETPRLHALNKIDRPGSEATARSMALTMGRVVPVSARTGEGLEALRDELADLLRYRNRPAELLVPAAEGRILALLREAAHIQSEIYEEDRVRIRARVPARMTGAVAPFLVPDSAGGEETATEREREGEA